VRSVTEGHIQSLDIQALTDFAGGHKVLLYLTAEPGEFVVRGQVLANIYGDLDLPDPGAVRKHFIIGDERSPTQDLFYLSDQLLDIAGRALSPGVNDPQTAISCIHWLNSTLAHLGHRRFPSKYRTTEDNRVVLVTVQRDFTTFVDSFYDQLRQYVERDRNTSIATLESAIKTMECLPPTESLALRKAATRLVEGCRLHFTHRRDIEQLQDLQRRISQTNSSSLQLRKATSVGNGGDDEPPAPRS
jgi:uncharacterized membrane protein